MGKVALLIGLTHTHPFIGYWQCLPVEWLHRSSSLALPVDNQTHTHPPLSVYTLACSTFLTSARKIQSYTKPLSSESHRGASWYTSSDSSKRKHIMESPPDPASDPGNGVSEPVTPVRETPVNLETLRKAEHQAPVRRQSCSSTNRGERYWLFEIVTTLILRSIDEQKLQSEFISTWMVRAPRNKMIPVRLFHWESAWGFFFWY